MNNQAKEPDDLWAKIFTVFIYMFVIYAVVQCAEARISETDQWWSKTTSDMADAASQKTELIKLLLISLVGILGAMTAASFLIRSFLWMKRKIALRREIAMFITRK